MLWFVLQLDLKLFVCSIIWLNFHPILKCIWALAQYFMAGACCHHVETCAESCERGLHDEMNALARSSTIHLAALMNSSPSC